MAYHLFALFRLVLGTLYPAYASYKAVRTKNVREYVKWMMYWIVFAAFSLFETFADIFVAFWFPFYYEVKILLLIWLISPVSRGSLGSSIIYRKFVHPALMKREDEIDHMMLRMQEQGYHTLAQFGGRAFTYVSNFVMQTAIKGGGGLVTQLKKSYSLTDLVLTPDNDESSKFDTRSTRRALPQITDITDDYYEEDSRLRERTFSEGSTAKAQQQRETNPVRRRNFSPGSQGRNYEENIDEQDGISGHNTIPRDTRYYHPESETNIRRMSPRKPNQNYDTSPIMEHYPEAIARKSPQRGQIIVYQDQPSMLYTEDSELVDVDRQRRSASLSTSPNHTPQHTNKSVRSKKTSCPSGTFVTHRGKPVRSRPKSLAFDHNVIDMHSEDWLNEYTESSTISNVNQPDFQIRKYRSVISLNSDNTSSVKAIPQLTKSKSVHQSPVKHARTPKMIDVSPQYFAAGSSSQIKSKEQGASRVKQLLFRRMSRSSEGKNSEVLQNIPISKRSQSSSSPTTRSNMRFLRKKTNDDEEDYLLPSPHDDDNDDFDSTHDQIYSSHNDPLTLYSSGEESN